MKKALKNVFASQELKLNIFLYRWEDQSHGQSRQEGELCAVARHPLPIPYPQNFLYESSYPRHFVVPGWWWPEVTSKGTSFLLLSTSPGTAPSSTASIFQVNHISECHCLFFFHTAPLHPADRRSRLNNGHAKSFMPCPWYLWIYYLIQ